MDDNPNKKAKDYMRLAGISSVGIGLVVSTLMGAGAGYWLDKQFHTDPFILLAGMILGIAAGFLNIFRYIGKE